MILRTQRNAGSQASTCSYEPSHSFQLFPILLQAHTETGGVLHELRLEIALDFRCFTYFRLFNQI